MSVYSLSIRGHGLCRIDCASFSSETPLKIKVWYYVAQFACISSEIFWYCDERCKLLPWNPLRPLFRAALCGFSSGMKRPQCASRGSRHPTKGFGLLDGPVDCFATRKTVVPETPGTIRENCPQIHEKPLNLGSAFSSIPQGDRSVLSSCTPS
jgi:hypothetical protein